jgi:hypothetical protein
LPFLVGPTHWPPFLPARKSRRRSTRTSRASPARPVRPAGPPQPQPNAVLFPVAQPPPACGRRREAAVSGQILPAGADPQHPEHAFEAGPVVGPRAAAPGGPSSRREVFFDPFPSFVREFLAVHARHCNATRGQAQAYVNEVLKLLLTLSPSTRRGNRTAATRGVSRTAVWASPVRPEHPNFVAEVSTGPAVVPRCANGNGRNKNQPDSATYAHTVGQ